KMTGPRLPNAYTIDSLIQYIQRDIAVFPDWKYSVENMVAQGDTVAVKIAQFGVQANEYMGIKPKANQISRAAIFITVFSNGKLKETWILQDNLGFMEQIGMQLTVKPEDKTKGKR
ncbi:MAG: ester cyclase, partial [Parabacteroides sp.]